MKNKSKSKDGEKTKRHKETIVSIIQDKRQLIETIYQEKLTQTHIDSIIETGFDWLISPQKIAVRAYTMTVLYLFGLKNDWIHPELSHLISTKIIHEGKGCKARGIQVLDLIEKHKKSDI